MESKTSDDQRAQLLPRSRTDHRLPPELYAFNLQQVGVDVSPEDLIRTARIAFMEIRNEMRAIAPLVARERDLEVTDYRDVMRALKAEQLVGDEILTFYRETMRTLQEIVIREDIVSIPERDAVVRLATEAESAQIPAPFMQPPRLIGNTGEYPEFVLPLSVPAPPGQEALKLDDFTHKAVAWSLSVHEARPGHELQFATMVERGVSTARAVFAFNSVNVEGWALYAEAVMKPYLPLDGQLFSLQLRLMRAARAFLDPMVNLGLITPAEVQRFLEEQVVLSPAMADSEVRRYTFMAPGQATAYFYGYIQLMAMRAEAELELGDRFDRKAFHDFILSQGMLPPNLLEKAVLQDFVGSRRVAAN